MFQIKQLHIEFKTIYVVKRTFNNQHHNALKSNAIF